MVCRPFYRIRHRNQTDEGYCFVVGFRMENSNKETPYPYHMKRILKIVGYTIVILVIVVAGLLVYVKTALPNVGDPENLTIEYTPARIERGKYLANSVCVCMDCHSTRDFTKFSGPLVEGTLGKGGDRFDFFNDTATT